MRDFSKNRRGKAEELLRLVAGILGVALLALLFFFSARAAWNMYQKFAEAGNGREVAEQELRSLQEKEGQINTAVAALSSDRGVEAEIRARFGVAKPGEGEITIVRDKEDAAVPDGGSKNLWERIVQALSIW